MTDFFGGVLDSIRGAASDFPSLGLAVAKAVAGGSAKQDNSSKLEDANRLAKLNDVPMLQGEQRYSPSRNIDKANEATSANFESIEQAWLLRLHRFGQIDESVNSGKVNEGVPR